MTTHTDEPQEPTPLGDRYLYRGVRYTIHAEALAAYCHDLRTWARTRIAGLELAAEINSKHVAEIVRAHGDAMRLQVDAGEAFFEVQAERDAAIATAARLREVLERLQRRGGLGLDAHEWIAAALTATAPAERDARGTTGE